MVNPGYLEVSSWGKYCIWIRDSLCLNLPSQGALQVPENLSTPTQQRWLFPPWLKEQWGTRIEVEDCSAFCCSGAFTLVIQLVEGVHKIKSPSLLNRLWIGTERTMMNLWKWGFHNNTVLCKEKNWHFYTYVRVPYAPLNTYQGKFGVSSPPPALDLACYEMKIIWYIY